MSSPNFRSPAFEFEGTFSTIIVEISKSCISHFCSTIEAFDNLALVRTMEPGLGRLWIYTNTENIELLTKVIHEFGREFPISISLIEEGMKGLNECDWS